MILRRLISLVLAGLFLAGLPGCGGDRDKGTFAGKDVPTPPAKK
jgi:hypothetical protein